MECGEKIAELRRANNMTQADLGAKLNVTFQAVSKWERGESYPDFETMVRIAEIFHVKVEYFSANASEKQEEIAVTQDDSSEQKVMRGVCTVCGKVIYEGDEGESSPVLICKNCLIRRKQEAERKEQERLNKIKQEESRKMAKKMEISAHMTRQRNKGWIWGCVAAAAFLLLGAFVSEYFWVFGILSALSFLVITQWLWGGAVADVLDAGGKVIGTPGVIFTLDLDGVIFLIVCKILFAVLRMIVYLASLAVLYVVAAVIAPFTFIPRLVKLNRNIKNGDESDDAYLNSQI